MHDYSICFKIAPKVNRAVPFLPLPACLTLLGGTGSSVYVYVWEKTDSLPVNGLLLLDLQLPGVM